MASNGSIQASNRAVVNVSGSLTNNGTLNISNSMITVSNGFTNTGNFTVSNVTLNVSNGVVNGAGGVMNITNALTFNGNLTNQQTGRINLGSGEATLLITGNSNWNNSGRIAVDGGYSIVNMTNANIFNTGNFSIVGNRNQVTTSNFTNNGTLSLSGSNQTSLTVTGANGLINNNSITIGDGTVIQTTSFSNNGTLAMSGASTISSSNAFDNTSQGLIYGNGSLNTADSMGTVTNNGTISVGYNGAVNRLTIGGNYQQNATGTLKLYFAGVDSYDRFNVGGTTTLGGTLSTNFLNAYTPAYGSTFNIITNSVTGYFRNVTGTVVSTATGKQMLKPSYNVDIGLSLRMSTGADISYVAGANADWGNASSWSNGYIPTAIDRVSINSGIVARHTAGVDTVDQITILGGGSLNVTGGNLSVASTTSLNGSINVNGGALSLSGTTTGAGSMTVSNGSLNLSGSMRLNQLTVNGGNIAGDTAAVNISESFQQTGGSIVLGDAAFNQASGNTVVGNITANNLVLESESAAIVQNTGTALHVKKQLITSSVTGTTLNNSGNQIAAFAANNGGSGDISLTNSLNTGDTSVVALTGVTNSGGNITIDNTGGMTTQALGSGADFFGNLPMKNPGSVASKLAILGIDSTGIVKSSTGKVTLTTHSPLSIGSAGITASGDIALTAGDSQSLADNLTINGALLSQHGNISLSAGNNINVNANLSAAGTISYAAGRGATSTASGITITQNGSAASTPGIVADALHEINETSNQSINHIITTIEHEYDAHETEVTTVRDMLHDADEMGTTNGGTHDHFGSTDDDTNEPLKKNPLPVCT